MSIYFFQPGRELTVDEQVEILKRQDNLVKELFAEVKGDRNFKKGEREWVQKSFGDLRQLFTYVNLEHSSGWESSLGEKSKPRKELLKRYNAQESSMAIVNLVNRIQNKYARNFSRPLITRILFLNYSAKSYLELKTLNELEERAISLNANYLAGKVRNLKEYIAAEEKELWGTIKSANLDQEVKYARIINLLERRGNLFKSEGSFDFVQSFKNLKENYPEKDIDDIIVWADENKLSYLPHGYVHAELARAYKNQGTSRKLSMEKVKQTILEARAIMHGEGSAVKMNELKENKLR